MKALYLSIFGLFFFVSLFAFVYGYEFKSIGEVFVYLSERLPLDEAKSVFDWIFGDLFSYVDTSDFNWYDKFLDWSKATFSGIWDSIVSWFDSGDGHIPGPSFGAR